MGLDRSLYVRGDSRLSFFEVKSAMTCGNTYKMRVHIQVIYSCASMAWIWMYRNLQDTE